MASAARPSLAKVWRAWQQVAPVTALFIVLGVLMAVSGMAAQLAQVLLGCERGAAALVRAGLDDVLVEPRRAPLIAGFDAVKRAALAAGAMGASISGAGPSVFAWCESLAEAERAAQGMAAAFAQAGFDSDVHITPIASPAAAVIA